MNFRHSGPGAPDPPGPADVFARVVEALGDRPFTRLDHPAVTSAAHAAALRGTALGLGGKALVMKLDRLGFVIVALPGDRTVDNRALRRALGLRRYRFATEAELLALTGLTPGCVPPFGRPVFDLPLLADESLLAGTHVAFTPGLHTVTLVVSVADWRSAARPEQVLPLSSPPSRPEDPR